MSFLKRIKRRASKFLSSCFSFFRSPTLAERLVLTGALVGVASGFASFVFIRLIGWMTSVTLGKIPPGVSLWHDMAYLFFPAAGILSGYLLIRFLCPEAHGHGTEILKILPDRSPALAVRVAIVKLIASATTIGFGGSAGQEGPVIQIGGATGSFLGKYWRVPAEDVKVLIAAGAAAGLGASFGAPLAAVFFIMEVVLKDFASSLFSSIVIAAVSGAVTSRMLTGDVDFVLGAAYTWHKPSDLLVYAALGLLCAPLGLIYKAAIEKVENYCERKKTDRALPRGSGDSKVIREEPDFPAYAFPVLGGLILGAMALFYPEVLGTGRKFIDRAFMGELGGWRMGALALAKIMATALTLGTGGSGGAFMPAIFIGAAAGSALNGFLGRFLASAALSQGSFAIVGMASVVTSSYRAPITGIIMALEMSRDYGIVMPVMAACAVSLVTAIAIDRGGISDSP